MVEDKNKVNHKILYKEIHNSLILPMTATFLNLFIYFVWRLITLQYCSTVFLPNINMNLKNRNYLILSEYFFSFFMGWARRALSTHMVMNLIPQNGARHCYYSYLTKQSKRNPRKAGILKVWIDLLSPHSQSCYGEEKFPGESDQGLW